MIYATHGVAPNANSKLFVYRNLLDEERFMKWLRRRPRPFVSLADALRGGDDALTIDDGTHAAASAAKLAAELGHSVTLFVNPRYSISDEQYFFALLNTALDECRRQIVYWRGQTYDFHLTEDPKRFRARVKDELRDIDSDTRRDNVLYECLDHLGQTFVQPPSHLHTLGIQDLIHLKNAGVAIENHGWTHGEIATLTDEQVIDEIKSAYDWIEAVLGISSGSFAVPFGETLPPAGIRPFWKTWFLLTDQRPTGWVSDCVYNRQEVIL